MTGENISGIMINTIDFTQYNQQTLNRLIEINKEIVNEENKPNLYVLIDNYNDFKKGMVVGETAEEAEKWCQKNEVPCYLVNKNILKTDPSKITKLKMAQLMRGLELNYGADWIFG